MRGVCLDSQNPGPGTPTIRQLAMLARPAGHRLVAFDEPSFYAYEAQLRKAGFGRALVLTSQSFDMSQPLGPQCTRWAQRLQPDMFILGNEWNIQGDASWPIGTEAFIALWNECAPALRAGNAHTLIYTGGMFCGDGTEGLVDAIWPELHVAPDGVDFHPYLAVPDFAAVRARHQCGISVGEWNDSDPCDLQAFQRVLAQQTDHSFYFCMDDRMVPNMGLVDGRGRRKSQWYAYHEALA